MRKSALFVSLLICIVLVSACRKRIDPTTVEVRDPVRHYFPILQGQSLELVYEVRNVGQNSLVINEIQTSCGCIVLDHRSRIIVPPEQSQMVRLTYNSIKNIGLVEHNIWIYGNIAPAGVLRLQFDVNVVPNADYTRDYEELFREYSIKTGLVKELVDGKESERGYYVDPQ